MDRIKAFAGGKLDWFNNTSTSAKTENAPNEHKPVVENAAKDPERKPQNQENAEPNQSNGPNEAQTNGMQNPFHDSVMEDKLLWSTQYSYDEFINSLNVTYEDRGDTIDEKRHWKYPRRWKVKLENMSIVNCMPDSLTCFAEFDFGGTRTECRVQIGATNCILNKGETKNYIRTPVVPDVIKDVPRTFQCLTNFEYRGSYLDLEYEKLCIKLWRYRKYTINCLESIYEGQLLQFAKGDVHVEIPMYKMVNGERRLRCRISFDLYFQEMYDFELSFLNWRLNDVRSSLDLLRNSKLAHDEVTSGPGGPSNKTSPGKKGHSIFDRLRYYFEKHKMKKDITISKVPEMSPSTVTENTEVPVNELDEEYEKLLHDQDAQVSANVPRVTGHRNLLPSPRLHLSIKTELGFRHRGGLKLNSIVERNSKNCYWENVGILVFRGTLMDLEKAELDISVMDTNSLRGAVCVGQARLPLAGVIDYPYLRTLLTRPDWVCLKANIEGWFHVLQRWSFGFLSGSVVINRRPRYRQIITKLGMTLKSSPVMLVVTIVGVDQLITNEERGDVDSFVEVSFNGVCYRSSTCKGTLGPTWNEEILIPIVLGDGEILNGNILLKRDPIRFNVWGQYSDGLDKKTLYLGGTLLHLHQLFYNKKGTLSPRVKKTFGGNGSIYDRMFDVRVFSGPLRLQFLTREDRQSNLTVTAWVHPDLSDDKLPNKIDESQFTFHTRRLLAPWMRETYERLSEDWGRVVRLKHPNTPELATAFEVTTQYNQCVYLSTLIFPLHPPVDFETPNAIFHMIRCLPFGRKMTESVFTPDFFMKLGSGGAVDHAILHVCYLRGLFPQVEAYVCLGTCKDKRKHAWVATIDRKMNLVKFYDSTTGSVWTLKNRVVADNDCGEVRTNPKIPLETLWIMFNEVNIWLNVQNGSSDPQLLWYNVDDRRLWYTFSMKPHKIKECFIPRFSFYKLDNYQLTKLTNEVQKSIERFLSVYRSAQNLQTRWNRDEVLHSFMVTGLKFLHQKNTASEDNVDFSKSRIHSWKLMLSSRVPRSHHLVVVPFHFNTCNVDVIADRIKSNVSFLDSRERCITFAISTLVQSVPGNNFSVYVLVLVAYKIHERVRRRLVLERERIAHKQKQKRESKSEQPFEAVSKSPEQDENENGTLNPRLKAALENTLDMLDKDEQVEQSPEQEEDSNDVDMHVQDKLLNSMTKLRFQYSSSFKSDGLASPQVKSQSPGAFTDLASSSSSIQVLDSVTSSPRLSNASENASGVDLQESRRILNKMESGSRGGYLNSPLASEFEEGTISASEFTLDDDYDDTLASDSGVSSSLHSVPVMETTRQTLAPISEHGTESIHSGLVSESLVSKSSHLSPIASRNPSLLESVQSSLHQRSSLSNVSISIESKSIASIESSVLSRPDTVLQGTMTESIESSSSRFPASNPTWTDTLASDAKSLGGASNTMSSISSRRLDKPGSLVKEPVGTFDSLFSSSSSLYSASVLTRASKVSLLAPISEHGTESIHSGLVSESLVSKSSHLSPIASRNPSLLESVQSSLHQRSSLSNVSISIESKSIASIESSVLSRPDTVLQGTMTESIESSSRLSSTSGPFTEPLEQLKSSLVTNRLETISSSSATNRSETISSPLPSSINETISIDTDLISASSCTDTIQSYEYGSNASGYARSTNSSIPLKDSFKVPKPLIKSKVTLVDPEHELPPSRISRRDRLPTIGIATAPIRAAPSHKMTNVHESQKSPGQQPQDLKIAKDTKDREKGTMIKPVFTLPKKGPVTLNDSGRAVADSLLSKIKLDKIKNYQDDLSRGVKINQGHGKYLQKYNKMDLFRGFL
ncbi:bifunctional C2 domain/C2 domain superfamily [Babesia duncani]|uniref:Bifunctional C2 domain/C2 domain superfamily n=1 Tax=Babesia duncani TaxID=323732 RepID=A0AAD9PLB3_9APIC|nr:bifunctional C2 domain/C2 domain superfamily [Babesia duncani]